MTLPKNLLALGLALFGLGACSSAPSTTVSGTLAVSSYPLSNAVVIAQSSDHRVYVSPVATSGRFSLSLPAGPSYRFVVANTLANGQYRVVSRIAWVSGRTWGFLGAATRVELGGVRPTTTATQTSGLQTQSDTAGEENESGGDDDAAEVEDDEDDEHDDAVACESDDETESTPDQDAAMQGSTGDDDDHGDDEDELSAGCAAPSTPIATTPSGA